MNFCFVLFLTSSSTTTLRRNPLYGVDFLGKQSSVRTKAEVHKDAGYDGADDYEGMAPITTSRKKNPSTLSRRDLIVASMAGLTAEAAWRMAVETAEADAAITASSILPEGTIEQLEAGRAVVIPNWLSKADVARLRADCKACYEGGQFSDFVYSKDNSSKENHDPWFMPSFYPRRGDGKDGPFVDPQVGDLEARLQVKARMAQVKAALASQLQGRATLADDVRQTHEVEYVYYNAGGFLKRHVDERHLELKRPNGSRLPLKPNATRRSITWLVYLNYDDWEAEQDGGQLRVYERRQPPASVAVGARGRDLQIGWLTNKEAEDEPVFLDPARPLTEGDDSSIVDKESCMLYTTDADGNRRNLSRKPFANAALYLAGGGVAEAIMMDDPNDAKNFRRIDTPVSLMSSLLKSSGAANDDERIRDLVPAAGTLVMFDSVALPHQVLQTNRERFGVQGWFHEKLYSYAS